MATDIVLRLTQFSAGDVERVTDLGTTLQREWRRRGFIPSPTPGSKASFDVFSLTELWVMKRLADHGIGPAASSRVAAHWAAAVVEKALQDSRSYGGHFLRFLKTVPLKEMVLDSPESDATRFGETFAAGQVLAEQRVRLVKGTPYEMLDSDVTGSTDAELTLYRQEWRETIDTVQGRTEWLAGHVLYMAGGLMYLPPGRFLLWWPGDRYERVMSLDSAFDHQAKQSIHGADSAVVLDSWALARTLLHRAGKPLVTVTVEDTGIGREGD